MRSRLLIVDRDGVINEDSPNFIKGPDEWVPIPGSLHALGLAHQHGFLIHVVTNQSGIARGLLGIDDLHRIHRRLRQESQAHGGDVDAFFFCPHGPRQGCACRKPQPGMVLASLARSGISPAHAVMIGDRMSDLQAAQAAGVRPILVRTGHGHATAESLSPDGIVNVFEDLAAAVRALCQQEIP
jgi:D-glycero-D-manno-heptose 1,7-bisphosphate phosphatase